MSEFYTQIIQCDWCNPYCIERIKMNTLKKLEKDWWSYGENSRAVVRDIVTVIPADKDGET